KPITSYRHKKKNYNSPEKRLLAGVVRQQVSNRYKRTLLLLWTTGQTQNTTIDSRSSQQPACARRTNKTAYTAQIASACYETPINSSRCSLIRNQPQI
ncbi:unnamed protein product, partial [Pylaiella littoralis]